MQQVSSAASDTGPSSAHREFFDLSPALLCTLGAEGEIREANESLLTVLGHEADALLGHPFSELVHPDDAADAAASIAALTGAPDIGTFENRCRHHDGGWRTLAWRGRHDPELDVVHLAARDETDQRDQAEVVARLLAELERSNTELAQFAYVASHDLSEPLRMVSSYVQLLADRYRGKLDDDADEFIAFAVDGATRMKVLIDDLLAFSRAGGSAIVRRPVDCAALVRTSLGDLDQVIRESDAEITVGELPTVIGDPGQLAQVLQNLVSNALKFVVPGVAAKVTISAERLDDAWCFSVADNGIGIPPVHRERVFLMFKRLHGRSEYPGTGIGLALCHKIVSRFGGRIWFEEGVAEGSIARFTVPDLAVSTAPIDEAVA